VNTEPAIRAALTQIITDIPGRTFVVNDRERKNINSYIWTDGTIAGFYVANGSVAGDEVEDRRPLDVGGAIDVIRTWTVGGVWEFDDEGNSEATFRAVLASICDALTPHRTLGNGASITGRLPSIRLFRFARFGQKLTHVGMIELQTRSEEHP
jgi:hypothetical protein